MENGLYIRKVTSFRTNRSAKNTVNIHLLLIGRFVIYQKGSTDVQHFFKNQIKVHRSIGRKVSVQAVSSQELEDLRYFRIKRLRTFELIVKIQDQSKKNFSTHYSGV